MRADQILACILGRIYVLGKGLPCKLAQVVQGQAEASYAGALRDSRFKFVMLRIPHGNLNLCEKCDMGAKD